MMKFSTSEYSRLQGVGWCHFPVSSDQSSSRGKGASLLHFPSGVSHSPSGWKEMPLSQPSSPPNSEVIKPTGMQGVGHELVCKSSYITCWQTQLLTGHKYNLSVVSPRASRMHGFETMCLKMHAAPNAYTSLECSSSWRMHMSVLPSKCDVCHFLSWMTCIGKSFYLKWHEQDWLQGPNSGCLCSATDFKGSHRNCHCGKSDATRHLWCCAQSIAPRNSRQWTCHHMGQTLKMLPLLFAVK